MVSFHRLVDIIQCWIPLWVTSDIDVTNILIYANVIDAHMVRKREMVKVDGTKVLRHAQVDNDVL